MIYVTGDLHGRTGRLSDIGFPEQKGMTKADFVIILGDFGIVWDYLGETCMERYWLDWLEKRPFTTLFLNGNHDNFDRVNQPGY